MEYPFITLGDGTQIPHSEMLADRSVLVYIRRGVLCQAVYALPAQEWREVAGFTEDELEHIKRVIVKMTPLILEFSQKGGFRGASGLEDWPLLCILLDKRRGTAGACSCACARRASCPSYAAAGLEFVI